MEIRNINNRQNFGMKIPHTDALGDVIRFWRMNGAKQKDINKTLTAIKKMAPDTFSFKVRQFNNTVNMKSGAIKYSLVFKDDIQKTACTDAKPYELLKNVKKIARNVKNALIQEKGSRAVIGKGIY